MQSNCCVITMTLPLARAESVRLISGGTVVRVAAQTDLLWSQAEAIAVRLKGSS